MNDESSTTLNLRVRVSTVQAIMAEAKKQGLTQKQLICLALSRCGVGVADADLEDRTPRRWQPRDL